MTFLLFVLSAVVLEAILAFDQRREQKRKASRDATEVPLEGHGDAPSEGLLPLLQAIERHGRGASPGTSGKPVLVDPAHADSAYNRGDARPK